MDVDPVLAPGGARRRLYAAGARPQRPRLRSSVSSARPTPKPDELRQVNVDGTGDKLMLAGRKGEPEQQLCDFRSKQFSSDGRRLYFLTPGWATSGALHVYDMRNSDERFVLPANDLLVLNFCSNKYKDDLVVEPHRYFLLGGSYDWYWLYDSGRQERTGTLGASTVRTTWSAQAHGVWCESRT